jgi:hypothetical protein
MLCLDQSCKSQDQNNSEEKNDNEYKYFNNYVSKFSKSLSVYKTKVHDVSWVYTYTKLGPVIYDKFPKSMLHLLMLPYGPTGLSGRPILRITDFKINHLFYLYKVHNICRSIAKELNVSTGLYFKIGYHINPSMDDLHIHIISNDFCNVTSESKMKSYTKKYFVTIDEVEIDIKKYGHVKVLGLYPKFKREL